MVKSNSKQPNWPSKNPGKPSGPRRDNNPSKPSIPKPNTPSKPNTK